jgi:hypothetical protein
MFLNPFSLYTGYLTAQWTILILGPLLAGLLLYKKLNWANKRILQFAGLFFASILITPLIFYYGELALRQLKIADLNVAFQLVRNSKYLIFALYLMLAVVAAHLVARGIRLGKLPLGFVLLVAFLLASFVGKSYPKQFPMFGFDFFRGQIPDAFTKADYLPRPYQHLDSAIAWIADSTPANAVFAGNAQVRAGAKRSVIFDFKGAAMLIEENKAAYVNWAKNNIIFEDLPHGQARFDFYRRLGAEYVLTKEDSSNQELLIKTFYEWKLYKLKTSGN